MEKDRELVIVMAEAEKETVAIVNYIMQKYGLPCFLMESIIAKVHLKLLDGKADELSSARNRENNKTEEKEE